MAQKGGGPRYGRTGENLYRGTPYSSVFWKFGSLTCGLLHHPSSHVSQTNTPNPTWRFMDTVCRVFCITTVALLIAYL